ncbi:hypothetical protein CDAR_472731 [Caerostris darwini]|uniref:Uncharacterized protein n=1 Tax=Caerostris darwini TaxID=1538125 RepID=A0AAV4T3T5_9ARAC|nr:hypothetical protein CDAR_472731 [Caerostris darwini]
MADRELQFRSREVEERSVHCFSDRQGCKMAVATEPKVEPCHRKDICVIGLHRVVNHKGIEILHLEYRLTVVTLDESFKAKRIISAHFLETVREMRRTKWRCWM